MERRTRRGRPGRAAASARKREVASGTASAWPSGSSAGARQVRVRGLAVGIGGYEIWRQWGDIHHALVRIGPLASLGALTVLFMQFSNLRAWQVLLAGLGSPLRTTTVGRIYFIGQLGKYLPGSVWPILAQMELGTAYRVPRARSATTAVLAMMMGLLPA